jgi:pilus assembly protein Flp/PilA
MKSLLVRFAKDQAGVTAIEYGLIAALVAVGLIVGATALGKALNTQFTGLAARMKG